MWTCKSRISAGHYLLILFISFYNASTFYLQEQLMLLTDLHSSYRSHVHCSYVPPDWQHPSSTMTLFASFGWPVNPFASRNCIRIRHVHNFETPDLSSHSSLPSDSGIEDGAGTPDRRCCELFKVSLFDSSNLISSAEHQDYPNHYQLTP